MSQIDLGTTADFHVHMREGAMMELVAPTVREGGISLAYIMPNLVPPITTIERVVEYKRQLEAAAPETTFLMTFYLSRELTPELVEKAAQMGVIRGIKCYPAGVTTNSSAGVDPNDFSAFYPIFEVMQKHGLVLNLHGEKPSVANAADGEDIHVLNAEPKFLPALFKLHADFPQLKIVLEHCTTQAAVEAIDKINAGVNEPVVAASITAHHLYLTIDSWAGNPINFCKPVAKLPADKRALIAAATSGKPYFFFGSDSAPHPLSGKARHVGVCAGVFTQSHAVAYLAEVFEKAGALHKLRGFVSDFGKDFYGVKDSDLKSQDRLVLFKQESVVPELIGEGELVVAPFMPGGKLSWSYKWIK